jgi:DNA primase
MAQPGSFAEKVKQQADIVRVVGEYVRLKKAGQNFTGLCPFHPEKTPSFAVHPTKQIYHCFGCGAGGDVFKFVMEMEKCPFPEAMRVVAEKCGIRLPERRERTPEERRESQQRTVLLEMHTAAAEFFTKQLRETAEGKVAAAYLEERGVNSEVGAAFGLGYAPGAGDALARQLRRHFPEKLLVASGLFSQDAGGRPYDRFRRRVIFPIANETGKVIAFGGRALGDEQPKYLNSPETPIYTKSRVLYHLHNAREAIRQSGFAVLVEGYMDAIAVAGAGFQNVVASCGTSLAEPQVALLSRFAQRVVVNYDPDTAGIAATERSIGLLLEKDFDVRVLALPGGADPDAFIRRHGAQTYKEALAAAPPYLDYLIGRARQMDLSSVEGKVKALNFLLPFVQRLPNRIARSEWASRIAAHLSVDEPVLRESLRRAAAERRGEVKARPEMVFSGTRPVEKRLIKILAEAEDLRGDLARVLEAGGQHRGLATEKIFDALIGPALAGDAPDPAALAETLEEKDSRTLFGILFEQGAEATQAEVDSCMSALQRRKIEDELGAIQKQLEAPLKPAELREWLGRKQRLQRDLSNLDNS